MKFLFLQYEKPLGAAVMATATFRAMRAAFPDAYIAAVCGRMAWQVLKYSPHIDAVIPTPNPLERFPAAAWTFLLNVTLSGPRFDYVITDASNTRTKIALLARLARASNRIGFTLRPSIYDKILIYRQEDGLLASNMQILAALGHPVTAYEPAIYFTAGDQAAAEKMLGGESNAPRIAIAAQTSGGYPEQRLWRDERFAAAADCLVAEIGARIFFVGTEGQRPDIDRVRSFMTAPSQNAAGTFSISQLAAFLAQCDLLLTLDTGALHVARGVGLPGVVIARPWQPPKEWLPVGNDYYHLLMKDEVVAKARSDSSYLPSMTIDEIGVDEVVGAILAQLSRFPSGRLGREKRRLGRLSRL